MSENGAYAPRLGPAIDVGPCQARGPRSGTQCRYIDAPGHWLHATVWREPASGHPNGLPLSETWQTPASGGSGEPR
jgi:hypothetical protein